MCIKEKQNISSQSFTRNPSTLKPPLAHVCIVDILSIQPQKEKNCFTIINMISHNYIIITIKLSNITTTVAAFLTQQKQISHRELTILYPLNTMKENRRITKFVSIRYVNYLWVYVIKHSNSFVLPLGCSNTETGWSLNALLSKLI